MSAPPEARFTVGLYVNTLDGSARFRRGTNLEDIAGAVAWMVAQRAPNEIVILTDWETAARCIVEQVDGCWQGRPT